MAEADRFDQRVDYLADLHPDDREVQRRAAQARSSGELARRAIDAAERDETALRNAVLRLQENESTKIRQAVGDVQPSPEPQGEEDAREEI